MAPTPNSGQPAIDPSLASLAPGARVGKARFTLIRLLGRGGMGMVWLAKDEQLGEEVALKFLPPEIRHDAAALDDLRRETSRSRRLTHPNIIRIHDLYKSDDEAFISMEYVEGSNLAELRLQNPDRVLKWSFLEPLVLQLCDALSYAHGENIVHRDLKPANLMLDGRGRMKLADFGIAATVSDSISRVSLARHALSGTATYMSPQQLDGELPQVTDDIYSVGSTLYELLTSRAPFFTGDVAHQVRNVAPQSVDKRLAQLRIENPLPPEASATIMACLAKDPAGRPQSAREIIERLSGRGIPNISRNGGFATPATATAAPIEAPTPPTQGPSPARDTSTVSAANETPPERSSSRRAGVVTVVALLAIAAIAGAWWFFRRSTPNGQAMGGAATNAAASASPVAPAPAFISIFNGRDFSGWDGDPAVWTVKDGTITATNGVSMDKKPVAIFWRGEPVQDFELQLSFKLLRGNSGIYYRARQLPGFEVGGYQYEIVGTDVGILIETGSDRLRREPSRRGSNTVATVEAGKPKLTAKGPTSASALELRTAYRQRDWNDVVITVKGNRVVHQLNGHTVIETVDEFEGRPKKGAIALEVYGREGTYVQFKDIRLKRLAQ